MDSICIQSPDPSAAAIALLPWWIPYVGPMLAIVYFFVGGVAASFVAGRLSLWATRNLADGHWTERARRNWSVIYAMFLAGSVCAIFASVLTYCFTGPFSLMSDRAATFLAMGALSVGFALGYWRAQRIVHGDSRSLVASLRGAASTTLVLHATYLACVLLIFFSPRDALLSRYLISALLVVAACQADAGFFVARALGLVRPGSARSICIVRRAAQRTETATPRVFQMASPRPNAVAIPIYGYVAFSDGALAELSDEELTEVAAHEIGHLGESRTALILRFLGPFPLVSLVLPLETPYLIVAGAFSMLSVWLMKRISARLEYRADRIASRTGESPAAYARALEHLYRVNLIPAVVRGSQTHPDLYDRMLAVGLEPDYPRPDPPPRSPQWWALLAPFVLVALAMLVGVGVIKQGYASSDRRYLNLVIFSSPRTTTNLARTLARQGEYRIAIALLNSVNAADEATQYSRLKLARTLAEAGCCSRALEVMADAQERGAIDAKASRAVWATSECERPAAVP